MNLLCVNHWDRDIRRVAQVRRHPYTGEYLPALCDDCTGDAYDARQEQDFAAYHGGDTPFNDAERDDAQGRRR